MLEGNNTSNSSETTMPHVDAQGEFSVDQQPPPSKVLPQSSISGRKRTRDINEGGLEIHKDEKGPWNNQRAREYPTYVPISPPSHDSKLFHHSQSSSYGYSSQNPHSLLPDPDHSTSSLSSSPSSSTSSLKQSEETLHDRESTTRLPSIKQLHLDPVPLDNAYPPRAHWDTYPTYQDSFSSPKIQSTSSHPYPASRYSDSPVPFASPQASRPPASPLGVTQTIEPPQSPTAANYMQEVLVPVKTNNYGFIETTFANMPAKKTHRRRPANVDKSSLYCYTCGSKNTPEWRRGPHGPATLCNACGLAYAKRVRQDEDDKVSQYYSSSSPAYRPSSPSPDYPSEYPLPPSYYHQQPGYQQSPQTYSSFSTESAPEYQYAAYGGRYSFLPSHTTSYDTAHPYPQASQPATTTTHSRSRATHRLNGHTFHQYTPPAPRTTTTSTHTTPTSSPSNLSLSSSSSSTSSTTSSSSAISPPSSPPHSPQQHHKKPKREQPSPTPE